MLNRCNVTDQKRQNKKIHSKEEKKVVLTAENKKKENKHVFYDIKATLSFGCDIFFFHFSNGTECVAACYCPLQTQNCSFEQ